MGKMIMCGFHGCHVNDTPVTRDCDCTRCTAHTMMCGKCNSFMAKARGSIFFSEAAEIKCDMCIEAARGG
jgi:hypothetical protein